MAGILSTVFQPLRALGKTIPAFSSLSPSMSLVKAEVFSLSSIRTKVRCYFPRPNEVRRVRRHGWDVRMSTPSGRRVIMRRLLKGRYVLSH